MVHLRRCILDRAKTHSDKESHFVDVAFPAPYSRPIVWRSAVLRPTALSHRQLGSMGPLELHKSKLRRMHSFYLRMCADWRSASDAQRKKPPKNGGIISDLWG